MLAVGLMEMRFYSREVRPLRSIGHIRAAASLGLEVYRRNEEAKIIPIWK
jgi:hypothetical protein